MRKCWRTIDPTLEPSDCIGPACMAYKNTQAFEGCAFVVAAHTTAVRNMMIIKQEQSKPTPEPETNDEGKANS